MFFPALAIAAVAFLAHPSPAPKHRNTPMLTNLAPSLKWILVSEGGYSNVKADPGGPTDYGITQANYNASRRKWGKPIQSVKLIKMDEVTAIYKADYWDTVKADELPSGLDYAVFDYSANSGPYQAIKDLQRTINAIGKRTLDVDGIIGPMTMEAMHDLDPETLIRAYISRRLGFMKRLGIWSVFGPGWTHRLFGQAGDPGVLKNALSLIVKPSAPSGF